MIAGIVASAIHQQGVVYPSIRATDARTYAGATSHLAFIGASSYSEIGDRLFVAISADNAPTISTPDGWTELSNNFTSGALRLKVVWKDKVADSEVATFITSSAVRTALVSWSVKAGTYQGAPAVSNASFSSSNANDLLPVTNPGGEVPALVVGVVGVDLGLGIDTFPLPDDRLAMPVSGQQTAAMCSAKVIASVFDPPAYGLSAAAPSIGRTILQR